MDRAELKARARAQLGGGIFQNLWMMGLAVCLLIGLMESAAAGILPGIGASMECSPAPAATASFAGAFGASTFGAATFGAATFGVTLVTCGAAACGAPSLTSSISTSYEMPLTLMLNFFMKRFLQPVYLSIP